MVGDLNDLINYIKNQHKQYEDAIKVVIDSYKKHADGAELILKRLEKVESRGRYKKKG